MHILRVIHRWVGIALAIPIGLVALSGGLLLFKDPYHRLQFPALADPITTAEVAGYAERLEQIEARFAGGIRIIRFPRDGANAFLVYLADGSEAFVHPATGEILGRWHPHESLPAFLFQLHAHLLAGDTGEIVNGYLSLVLVFLGFTGLLLWWPRRAAAFRLRRAVPSSTTPGDLLRSHAASGAFLAIPVVLFAATGAGLVFYEPASRFATALLDPREPEAPSAVVGARPGAVRRPWTEILTAVNAALPEAGPTMYYPGAEGNAVLTFRKSLPGELHPNGRSYVLVNPYRAEVVQSIDARTQGAGTRIMHALYPVHAAMVGGPAFAFVAFVSAFGLVWLAIAGSWAYLARSARRPVAPMRAPGTLRDELTEP